MTKKDRKGYRYLYECDDCHTSRMIPWVEQIRAARPKCYGCGCTRLSLVSEDAKTDAARLQAGRVAGSGGSLVLAVEEENTPHRKVT